MLKISLDPAILNKVYVPHLQNGHRYQIYYGGSSSGKSVFLAVRCVLDVLQGRNYLVVRQVSKTIRQSCWNEIVKAINRLGVRDYFNISKSEMVITAVNNGNQILFAGLDDVEKIKSTTPQNGSLTDIWMEEATECSYGDYKQLDKRLRGASKHLKRMTLSFNPVYKTHWIYREFFGIWDDEKTYAESETVSILKTTYKDNRFLTNDDRMAMENEKDPYFREVYTLGNWGVLGEVIFRNWHTEDLSETAKAYPLRYYGLDFGFSQDPCGVVDVAYDRKRRRIYIFNEMCERGLTNTALADRLKEFCGARHIACDSAEPKSIAELKNEGINAFPVKKGKDSVLHGIQWLQGHEIVVDTSCTNLRQEMTLYQWKQDKDGNTMAMPEDRNNHLIDALRYALEMESTQRRASTVKRSELGI